MALLCIHGRSHINIIVRSFFHILSQSVNVFIPIDTNDIGTKTTYIHVSVYVDIEEIEVLTFISYSHKSLFTRILLFLKIN